MADDDFLSDLAPLFAAPKKKPEELTADEYAEQYGPPFGPCGVPCDCETCQEYRKDLREAGPVRQAPVISRDKFHVAVEKVLASEPRSEWRTSIREARCFAKLWFNSDDESFCSEMDCDLRRLCQSTWEMVCGQVVTKVVDGETVTGPASAFQKRYIGGKLKPAIFPKPLKKDSPERTKWLETDKYERVPYVDLNRPVDRVARVVWKFLGEPPTLQGWTYPPHTRYQQEEARQQFITVYGGGILVCKRTNYHHYMYDGVHFFRLWVVSGGGGWADCNNVLSQLLLKDAKNKIEQPPKTSKKKYKYYPYRVFLSGAPSVERFKSALVEYPGLEFLSATR